MDAIAILKAQIRANASRRIRDAADEISRPKILHTQYLGDRTVQQLGQEPVENAVILNNAANTIGDALMPLAKGSPLQRFDSFNQDDGVGTAKRSLLDNDANRNGSNFVTLRTGEQEPANDPLKGTPRGRDPLPKDYPPPFGCVPLYPAKQCIWIPQSTSPSGYQSHGSAVINQDGLELFLHCQDGVVPPPDLGCTFLGKWKCSGGVCSPDATGTYNSQAECEAARIPPIPPLFPYCLVATYSKGNYTVAGVYGNCFSPTIPYSKTGNYQRIEVYTESCVNIAQGAPNNGCTPINPGFYFLIFGLTSSCTWEELHLAGISALANYTITKNSDIADTGCNSYRCP